MGIWQSQIEQSFEHTFESTFNDHELRQMAGDTNTNINTMSGSDQMETLQPESGAYDSLSKMELLNHIKEMDPHFLGLDGSSKSVICGVRLQNNKLIPMNIELYETLKTLLPKPEPKENGTQMTFTKRKFYVTPEFSPDDINLKRNPSDHLDEDLVLGIIEKQKIPFKIIPINIFEFSESFGTPDNGKDMMGMSKKILLLMSNFQKRKFVNQYNKLYKGRSNVKEISFGKAFYIYKGKGPKNEIKSFRQIVSLPNSVRHFHRILEIRLIEYLTKNGYLDTNIQKGGVKGISHGIFEQVYKIKSIVKDANKNKKSLALLFLDISNAFGNLHLKRLYEIMEKYHIESGFIKYVQRFYEGLEIYTETKKWKTGLLKWEDGLIQGCPLSGALFILALNYVLTYLNDKYKLELGYKMDNGRILFTAFVDDIAIMSNSLQALEDIYYKLSFYLECLGLPINKKKSAIMIINIKHAYINGKAFEDIPIVSTFKYLGEYLSADGTNVGSLSSFLAITGRKLSTLDKKQIENDTKLIIFKKMLLPWMQRKIMVMYDLDQKSRTKIINLIHTYTQKWGDDTPIKLFTNIDDILNKSEDDFINNIEKDEDYIGMDENNALIDHVLEQGVTLDYSQINKKIDL